MDLLASQTLGSAASTIDFTGIPATHTHLVLRGQVRGAYAATGIEFSMRLGSGSYDTGSNYEWAHEHNTGGFVTATDSSAHIGRYSVPGSTASAGFAEVEVIVTNYTSTSTSAKMVYSRVIFGTVIGGVTCRWNNSTSVNQVRFFDRLSGNLVTGSNFSVYGTTELPFIADNLQGNPVFSGSLLL